jgi:hypothetical protein
MGKIYFHDIHRVEDMDAYVKTLLITDMLFEMTLLGTDKSELIEACQSFLYWDGSLAQTSDKPYI